MMSDRNSFERQKITNVADFYYAKSLQKSSLICYILGYFTFVTHIASIGISFDLVARGYSRQKAAAIIVCGVFELLAWIGFLCSCWVTTCEYQPYGGGYGGGTYYPNYSSMSVSNITSTVWLIDYGTVAPEPAIAYYTCTWWGWIPLIIWYMFMFVFGLVRVICQVELDGIDMSISQQQAQIAMQPLRTVNVPAQYRSQSQYPSQPYYGGAPQQQIAPYGGQYPIVNTPVGFSNPTEPPSYYSGTSAAYQTMPVPQTYQSSSMHAQTHPQRWPSLETLALDLQMPKLLENASRNGYTVQQILSENFDALSRHLDINAEDYLKIKAYKKLHSIN